MRKKIKLVFTQIVICMLFMLACNVYASDLVVCGEEQMTDWENNVYIGYQGSFLVDSQAALDYINEIRLEACREGIANPNNPSEKLTMDDYHPLEWSTSLEKKARIRATEAAFTTNHRRLNDKDIWSIVSSGFDHCAENLAWYNTKEVIPGIEQFYDEKKYWITYCETGVKEDEYGHYTNMINPDFRFVGLGCFYGTVYFDNCLAMLLSDYIGDLGTTTMLPGIEKARQVIEVSRSLFKGYDLLPKEISNIDKSELFLCAKIYIENDFDYGYGVLRLMGDYEYSCDSNDVAEVSKDGIVTPKQLGDFNVTVKSNGEKIGDYKVTIKCVHEYEFSELDEDEMIDCVCKHCNEHRRVHPPTSGVLGFCNVDYNLMALVREYFPSINEIGSRIRVDWTPASEDREFCDLYVTCSDPSILEVPDKITAGKPNYINVVGSGIVTLTFTAQYNPNYVYVVKAAIGGYDAFNMEDVEIDFFSDDEAEYDQTEKKRAFSLYYKGVMLEDQFQFSSTFKNNVEVGKAEIVVEGKLDYKGTKTFTFDIMPRHIGKANLMIGDNENAYDRSISFEYEGETISPTVKVSDFGEALVPGVDYTYTYKDNDKVGSAYVVFTGLGKYSGVYEKEFFINHTGCTFGDWVTVREPDCTSAGLEERKCLYCDNKETRYTNSLQHRYICSKYDWSDMNNCIATISCDRCNEVINYVTTFVTQKEYVDATDTKDGYVIANAKGGYYDINFEADKKFILPAKNKPQTNPLDNPFTDVKNGKYYTDSILFLNNKGVMTGLNKTRFGFNSLLTREDMVTLLWKNEGKPSMNVTSNVFKDIKPGKYYTDAVSWAKKNNVVGGYTSGAKAGYFGKGDNITRQDFIKIIYGYAKFKGYNTSVKSADTYKEKSDASKVSKYARESMNWGYENGFIGNGAPLDPKSNIKRQDAAVIIARFLQAFEK